MRVSAHGRIVAPGYYDPTWAQMRRDLNQQKAGTSVSGASRKLTWQ